MNTCENPTQTDESRPSKALLEEIQRALEMMKRVRTANLNEAGKPVEDPQGNTYVLPEPLMLRSS